MKAIEQHQPNSIDSSDSVTGSIEYAYRPLTTKHRRAGSTGTTGDEEYTTDEDEFYGDEADCAGTSLHPPHPILKSDLARAATDLFGYSSKANDNDNDNEPTMCNSSVNDKNNILRTLEKINTVKQSISETELIKFPQHTRPLDLRMDNKTNCNVSVPEIPETKTEQPSEECRKKDGELMKTVDDPPSPTTLQWEKAVAEVKEHAIIKLQEELKRAHEELKLKDEEEAHNMVREANTRQATAERLLEESRMKNEVLAAEVSALKTLVLTSTPAQPNPHLHPQIDIRSKSSRTKTSLPIEIHASEKDVIDHRDINKEFRERDRDRDRDKDKDKECKDFGVEIDPILHSEFLRWKENPCIDKSDVFIARVFREDIELCLSFPNQELGSKVRQAVLDEVPRQCLYRMRLGDQDVHYSISQICRNRIIAVCDFLNYLRYIERGLVKSAVNDIFWEITRLRKEMVLARLGIALSS
ncbi:hypothetical protein G9C98_006920 [Cotesia typhae]|uniref:Guanine nucleotide exchange factor for Rab-3A n=1 Tax=Cotesia typhae TaxID=2053667 RepID=A0A8J5R250_9HYME|nr:hypothetical protein G9C98_006920 [Cotesia typhae]